MAYIDDDTMYFKGNTCPLSNMYLEELPWNGCLVACSEVAYQYEKLRFHELPAQAFNLLGSKNGFQAKRTTDRWLPKHKLSDEWHATKVQVMRDILYVKLESSIRYQQCLAEASYFVEDTQDVFWGRGSFKKGPGLNMLGKLHLEMKEHLPQDPPPKAVIISDSLLNEMQLPMGHQAADTHREYISSYPGCRSYTEIPTSPNLFSKFQATLMVNPGATVSRLAKRMERNSYLLSEAEYCFILVGTNSLSEGLSPQDVVKEVVQLRQQIQLYNTSTVVYVTTLPPRLDSYNTAVNQFNLLIQKEVPRSNVWFLHRKFLEKKTIKACMYRNKDKVHPNPDTLKKISGWIGDLILQKLADRRRANMYLETDL